MFKRKAAVLAAGSWGTALAAVLAHNGLDVRLWSRNAEEVSRLNEQHAHRKFPNITIHKSVVATTSLEEAIIGAEAVVIAAPSAAVREVARGIHQLLPANTQLIHAAKGFEASTLKRMSTVIAEELHHYDADRIVVLSGPSHAEEVIRRSPTTVVVAARRLEAAVAAQDLFTNSRFRVYTNPDLCGVELGGALKNIIALGAGMSDGLGFGDNAKAALVTRGLAEIVRLGVAMGGQALTFAGLSGIGDLMVTCTSKLSRNWRAGYLLAQEKPLSEVLAEIGMVVEGVGTTQAAHELSRQYGVTMPITNELYDVLFHSKPPRTAVDDLMGRGPRHEMEEVASSSGDNWIH